MKLLFLSHMALCQMTQRQERGLQMTEKLNELLDKAKKVKLSPQQKEEQRRSFAYGNTNIENSRITRETIDREAEKLKKSR
jgi:hypothetical protein